MLGYTMHTVPAAVLAQLKKEINQLVSTNFESAIPYNYTLAGAIEKEYRLTESVKVINEYTQTITPYYLEQWNNTRKKHEQYTLSKTTISDLWVNLQRKYEYNPLHLHQGILSFVIWINIPYNLDDERNLPSMQSKTTANLPSFNFRYPDFMSPGGMGIHVIEVDKKYEGKLILFPSCLLHEVTPFYTSDDYRISVSGNISLAA
jgi:hypothetical protein